MKPAIYSDIQSSRRTSSSNEPDRLPRARTYERNRRREPYSVDCARCPPSPVHRPALCHLWKGKQTCMYRMLHSPIPMTIGYEAWFAIGWHHPFLTYWSMYMLGLPQSQWIVGSCDHWEFSPCFISQWQFPCTALTTCKPVVGPGEYEHDEKSKASNNYIDRLVASITLAYDFRSRQKHSVKVIHKENSQFLN